MGGFEWLLSTNGTLAYIWSVSKQDDQHRPVPQGVGRHSRNPAVSINHLLKRIVKLEKKMYVLQRGLDTDQLPFSLLASTAKDRTGQGPTRSVMRILTQCKRLGVQSIRLLRASAASR